MKGITLTNIKDFVSGNIRMFGDRFNLLEEHVKEQIIYRDKICASTCGVAGKCVQCGCSYPGKLYVYKSCNEGKRFPDIMETKEWFKFKEDNNIIIED
jgi:hypothetical protein